LTASAGEWCHAAVTWASEGGAQEHPDWFPGEVSEYSFQDFQSLLHELGEAKCSRPCDSAGKRTLGLIQGQSFTRRVDVNQTYGLSQEELLGAMESSWAPKARIGALTADAETEGCQDLQPGSVCYNAVTWLRTSGIKKHPAWYPQVSGDSTVEEVQELLASLGRGDCQKPCQYRDRFGYQRVKLADDDKVLEVGVDGRQVVSEAYKIPERRSCSNTVEGEWCYTAIMWLKNKGLAKHPNWYRSLNPKSSIADFQTELHKQHKMSCPLPCNGQEGNTTANSEDEHWDTTTPADRKGHDESCELAQEGSACYKAISKVMDFNFWRHPEEYPGLTGHSSRNEVQEHLYQRGAYECGWPCPKEQNKTKRLIKKRISDMNATELIRYMDKSWDGYVDADEYDEYEPVQTIEKTTETQPPALELVNDSANESAPELEEEVAHRHLAIVKSTKSRIGANGLDQCRDARVGELCYEAVTWAQEVGIHDRPSWYPGLSQKSAFKEFQEFLHKTKGSLCEMPCGTSTVAAKVAESDAVVASGNAADTGPYVDSDGELTDAYEEKWESEREGRHRPPAVVPAAAEEPEAALEEVNSTAEVNATALEEINSSAEESATNSTAEESAANSTAEESAAEANTSREEDPFEAETSEDPLPSVDEAGQEVSVSAEEAQGTAEEANVSVEEAQVTAEEVNVSVGEAQADSSAEKPADPAVQPDDATVQADSSAEKPADGFYAEANSTEAQRLKDEHQQLMEEHARLQEEHTRLKEVLEAKRLKEEHEQLLADYERLKGEHERLKAQAAGESEPAAAVVEASGAGTSEDLLPEIDMEGQEANDSAEEANATVQDVEGQNSSSAAQSVEVPHSDAAEANSTAAEPAPQPESAAVEAEPGTSEDLLPEVDMDGQESDSPALELVMEPTNQSAASTEEVNSTTEEVNSTAEEPATQPADAGKNAADLLKVLIHSETVAEKLSDVVD
jgi:hypothetical protein